jgi:hypothetical protein
MIPKHVFWSINNKPFATFREFLDQGIKLEKFNYQILSHNTVVCTSFRDECVKAAHLLPNNLAIPVSGSDSEIVARSAYNAGKIATIYYEDYPWADPLYKTKSQQVAAELGYKWVGFEADYNECLDRMKYYSVKLGNMSRGFLITLGMFDKIPQDQYIVGGLGDFEKDSNLYKQIMNNCVPNWGDEVIIPCPPTEMIWWLYDRPGMYTFFNSTLPLVKSQATHPLLNYGKNNKGICNTNAMKNAEWPELCFKEKTNHFVPSEDFYDKIYYEMEQHMYHHYSSDMFTLVKNGFCGFVNYSKIFDKS